MEAWKLHITGVVINKRKAYKMNKVRSIAFEFDGKKYHIDRTCFETFPCCHDVFIDGKCEILDNVQITRLLDKVGIKDDHFNETEYPFNLGGPDDDW